MLNFQFLQGLNEEQQKAVLHGEGPALVAAGPGSGKTTCLTRRILYLIQECQVPPQEILVLTFTKEAAKAMQNKFKSLLKDFGQSKFYYNGEVHFATLHSFSYQIIQNIPQYSEYQIVSKQEKKRIAKEILKSYQKEDITENELNTFLNRISFAKCTGDFRKSDRSISEKELTEEEEVFRGYYKAFENRMHTYGRMDFEDMLYLCKKAFLSSKELLLKWQNKYKYILVDEFQDLNMIQYEIVRMLCEKHKNIYVVGDDDQAIYGFRGSFSGIFRTFLGDFPAAEQICLGTNYRCGKRIVEASKKLIEHNKMRVDKDLRCKENTEAFGKITCYESVDFKECVEKVIGKLNEYSADELQEQAILFRTNYAMQLLSSSLSANHIPYHLREKQTSIYEHFIVRDIMDYFEAAHGNTSREIYIRLFQKLPIPLGREALFSKNVELKKCKEFYRSGFYEDEEAVQMLDLLEKNLVMLQRMPPSLGVKFILHAMEYKKYLVKKSGNLDGIFNEWQQILDWILSDGMNFGDYRAWKKHQMDFTKELEKQASREKENKAGIHLLTLHAAKGLEFKKVYILNCNEGTIPQFSRGEILTKEKLEEERRLFYVGITRAKEELELHYLTGTQERPKFKSRFLGELRLPEKAAGL